MDKFKFYLAPSISEYEAKQLVFRLYGFKVVRCKELYSYVDKNFHIFIDPESLSNNPHMTTGISTDGYVLKILNKPHSENEAYIDAQDAMREHLNKNGLHCQETILMIDGRKRSREKFQKTNGAPGELDSCIVRLFTFLPGSILSSINATTELLYQVGQLVANVTNALQNFYHPGYDNLDKFWNIRNVYLIEEFVQYAPDENKQQLVKDAMKLFADEVEPYCDQLEKCIIHNDLSDQNMIVREKYLDQDSNPIYEVYGILDFDESLYNCCVFELPISLCYMMIECTILGIDNMLVLGGHVLAGYLNQRSLSEQEYAIVIPAVAARLCSSLCCGAYNYYQTKNEYSLTTSKRGWALLEKLVRSPREDILELWNEILKSYNINTSKY